MKYKYRFVAVTDNNLMEVEYIPDHESLSALTKQVSLPPVLDEGSIIQRMEERAPLAEWKEALRCKDALPVLSGLNSGGYTTDYDMTQNIVKGVLYVE